MKYRDLSIVDVVKDRVSIERKGRNFVLSCPFHDEKTPSMFLYPKTNSYYCFGCHKSGNVTSFVSEYHKISYKQALEKIKIEYDIDDILINKKTSEIDEKLLDFLGYTKFYLLNTSTKYSKEAMTYLENRNIDIETMVYFELGIIKNEENVEINFLTSKMYYPDYADQLLLFKSSKGVYTSFENRILFPIKDSNNNIKIFGGRTFDSSEPKYLFSKLHEEKGKSLYIYNLSSCRETEPIIICEGPFDVWALHQNGETNCAAIMGSSFSRDQIQLLERFKNKIYICLDSDEAGQSGVLKVLNESYIIRNKSEVILLDKGDPYDYYMISKKTDIKSNAVESNKFLLDKILGIHPKKLNIEKQELANSVFKLIIESNMLMATEGFKALAKEMNLDVKYIEKLFYEYEKYFDQYLPLLNYYKQGLYYISVKDNYYIIKSENCTPKKNNQLYRMYLTPFAKKDLENDLVLTKKFNSGENICIFSKNELEKVYNMINDWSENYED
jgi:DNA primase catalytic core